MIRRQALNRVCQQVPVISEYIPTMPSLESFFNVIHDISHLISLLQSKTHALIVRTSHPVKILLAMIYDRNPEIRELGYQKILHSREINEPIERELVNARLYLHPQILFDCENYCNMIDWDLEFTEPLHIKSLQR